MVARVGERRGQNLDAWYAQHGRVRRAVRPQRRHEAMYRITREIGNDRCEEQHGREQAEDSEVRSMRRRGSARCRGSHAGALRRARAPKTPRGCSRHASKLPIIRRIFGAPSRFRYAANTQGQRRKRGPTTPSVHSPGSKRHPNATPVKQAAHVPASRHHDALALTGRSRAARAMSQAEVIICNVSRASDARAHARQRRVRANRSRAQRPRCRRACAGCRSSRRRTAGARSARRLRDERRAGPRRA